MAGFLTDANHVGHGFVRRADGAILIFDAPEGINEAGNVTDNTFDANNASHGFVVQRR